MNSITPSTYVLLTLMCTAYHGTTKSIGSFSVSSTATIRSFVPPDPFYRHRYSVNGTCMYSGHPIQWDAADVTYVPVTTISSYDHSVVNRVRRGVRETPPDIYLVTPRRNISAFHFPERTVNGTTYKRVDFTDDIINVGLNRNIHLTDYLENTPNARLILVIKDRLPFYPFKYRISPNRVVLFVVDNDRLMQHFRTERKDLLEMALKIDPDDHSMLQNLYYRLSGVLDDDENLRHIFMRKIIRNLSRNQVSPIDLTIESLEKELADAQVIEFVRRQLNVENFDDLPIADPNFNGSLDHF